LRRNAPCSNKAFTSSSMKNGLPSVLSMIRRLSEASSSQRLEQLEKIAVQRFRVAGLDQDFISVAEHQSVKPIQLRFEDARSIRW
jgi:hypothetical protein